MTKKLTNVSKNCKAYWYLLMRLLNNKKLPLIPPLFHENKFVTDFKEKAELFNSHFVTQCSLISNSSKLPSHIQYVTDNRLSCVSFSHNTIATVIQNLQSVKKKIVGQIIPSFNQCCWLSKHMQFLIFFFPCFHNTDLRGRGDVKSLPVIF